MICPVLQAIEIIDLMERRMKHAVLSNFNSDSLRAFCRAYTRRFRNLSERDPKHADLYRFAAEFLVTLHERTVPDQTFPKIVQMFRRDCAKLGIE